MNHSFPKLFAIGTGYIADLFEGDVEITEKIDGSQFGFGKTKDGIVFCRSKGKVQQLEAPDQMFELGAAYVQKIADRLPEGFTFYGEYLNKPRHSTLAYDRVPKNNIMLFGVKMDDDLFIQDFETIQTWAETLDIEAVPLLFKGRVEDSSKLHALLETQSVLGGQLIEGFVAKRYVPWMFGSIVLPLMGGKYVSEKFKEVHRADWKTENTTKGGFEKLRQAYRTPARWNKAVQHLQDNGLLVRTPADIGNLIKEVRHDIVAEEKEEIKTALWKLFADDILKTATAGMPEWYKNELMESSFDGKGEE